MAMINKVEYFIGGGADKDDFLSGVFGGTKLMEDLFRARMISLPSGSQQFEYRGHEQEASIIQGIRVRRAANPRLVVNITGHSWGGQAAMRITHRLAISGIKIDELITLDPVALVKVPSPRSNANMWVNVHQKQTWVDHVATVPIVGNAVAGVLSGIGAMGDDTEVNDTIATTGGQLGAEDGAYNIETELHHRDVLEMYK